MTSLKRLRSRPLSLKNSRWAAYAAAGAVTAVGAASTAEADVTYSGPINQMFNGNLSSFPLALGGYFSLSHGNSFAGFFIGAPNSAMFRGTAAGSFRYPSRLGTGSNVSGGAFVANSGAASASLAGNGFGGYGNFLAPGIGFIGISFDVGAGTQYGWIRLNMDGSASGNTFTLVDYAFADPGEMITTGQIPEPGSLALLAVGAAGLLAWRKRRTLGTATPKA